MKQEIETEEIINLGYMIYHMRCAEHTFQLGIRDTVKKEKLEKFPSKILKIAQFLRYPHIDIVLKHRAGKSVLIDTWPRDGEAHT